MPLCTCAPNSCTCSLFVDQDFQIKEQELQKQQTSEANAQDWGGTMGAVTSGAAFGAGALAWGASLSALVVVGIPTMLLGRHYGKKKGGAIGGLIGVPIGVVGAAVAGLHGKEHKDVEYTRTCENGDIVKAKINRTPKAPIDALKEPWKKAGVGAVVGCALGLGADNAVNNLPNFGDAACDAAKQIGSAVGEVAADQAEKVIDRANAKLKPFAENMAGQVDKANAMADKGKATAASCCTAAIFSFLTVLGLAVLLRS